MQNPYERYQGAQGKSTQVKKAAAPSARVKPLRPSQTQGRKPQPKRGQTPWTLVAFLAFGFSLSLYVIQDADRVISSLQGLRIGWTGALAAEGEKSSPVPASEAAENTPSDNKTESSTMGDGNSLTMENSSVYKALKDKEQAVEKKTQQLARLEEELQAQKKEIERQLQELAKMRDEITNKIDRKVAADEASIQKLVGVYADMKPQSAALVMSQLDEGLAVQVLSAMKKQSAASILNFMEPAKAQVLSEKYAGLKK